jgi:YfiH family protein
MLLIKKEDTFIFQFEALTGFSGLTHAVGCRRGGSSRAPFDGMNLSLGVGDDPQAVAANRRHLQRLTGGGVHIYTRQIHGSTIRIISRSVKECAETIQSLREPADALITDVPGVRLLIQTADCQAVMLFDPQKRVVANIHCGWRGSAANIIGHTVQRMAAQFGCDPGRITAAIGPSLGPCCAEFINYQTELPQSLWPFRVGRHHFDFWEISRHQLAAAGLPDAHVHHAAICTRCNPHLFFSYRTAHKTGRFAALIGMDADNPPARELTP